MGLLLTSKYFAIQLLITVIKPKATSKIVGKAGVVRVRRCVVGDFFFVVKSLMWGLLALVKACKAWTILLLPTALVSVTDPVTATG
ncbi:MULTISPECIES: hypothetical protein [Shewanella]|uniref:hypothetical protein n=1 Tax=Shewanella TaxID=22 RepID=UPI000C3CBD5B|nr:MULTISPECIES: hypothetical protein [Shewanella]PIQ00738.1 MAG: hypothetical protein COW76_09060 [Shewanella sp. CG18_big_fil_WC_8_21_14_2_50_42_11]PIX71601.1 MAG: hypothetical protein COZ42_10095 [Shewanella sp. CG_4_10_14_3_um_filter_42_91]PIY66575.1 MAG: hypothetical protein COY92_09945 [Shewanella sp. CG_4_10_14_0_8_um_filter_42_13]PJB92103.1 MAG: hypothetical protein CO084_07960 [Shewanella sp. CG_4_9_14_0_8_um_filter_42_14]